MSNFVCMENNHERWWNCEVFVNFRSEQHLSIYTTISITFTVVEFRGGMHVKYLCMGNRFSANFEKNAIFCVTFFKVHFLGNKMFNANVY